MTLRLSEIETPVGQLLAALDSGGIVRRIAFVRDTPIAAVAQAVSRGEGESAVWEPAAGEELARELAEYFEGERRTFDLAIDPRGAAFDLRVWDALREVPYGQTVSYGDLAARIGEPGAARAVGRAAALNPIPILVPCHRVVGAHGKLTGYGGGLDAKQKLLALEGALPASLL
jgi:methylated-DNA-[protein]-cysteine S-methyltransferase